MSKLRDITMFPNVTVISDVSHRRPTLGDTGAHLRAHAYAVDELIPMWVDAYGRMPNWDILNVRGSHTTARVVLEFWEEG